MTAVALFMLGMGVLLLESAITNQSVNQAADAIINGKPIQWVTGVNPATGAATNPAPGGSNLPGQQPGAITGGNIV